MKRLWEFLCNSVKTVCDAVINMAQNVATTAVVAWQATDWLEKIAIGIITLVCVVEWPIASTVAAVSIIECHTHPLIKILVMFCAFWALLALASIAVEALIPCLFIVLLDWVVYVETQYARSVTSIRSSQSGN